MTGRLRDHNHKGFITPLRSDRKRGEGEEKRERMGQAKMDINDDLCLNSLATGSTNKRSRRVGISHDKGREKKRRWQVGEHLIWLRLRPRWAPWKAPARPTDRLDTLLRPFPPPLRESLLMTDNGLWIPIRPDGRTRHTADKKAKKAIA